MAGSFSEQNIGISAEAQDRAATPIIPATSDALFVSEVVDNMAHFGLVEVTAPASTPIMGIPISLAGNSVIGPRQIGKAYPVHTRVVCYRPPGIMAYCFVLGSVPDMIKDPEFNRVPDWLVPGSRSGVGFDRVHSGALERKNGISGRINFSSGSPVDELPGDTGYINDLGIGYGINRMFAWLRASHFCGVETHWLDNLLRLTGYNLEVQTSASELRAMNDEGEWSEVFRYGHLPWETLGVFNHGDDFTKHVAEGWNSTPGKAGREPQFDDQAGIWRVQRFRGYLGDLERTIVALPLADSYQTAETLASNVVSPGLADVGIQADGRLRLRSAKGVLIEKTVAIPVPKEKTLPDDINGDNKTNYKAAGVWGEGDEHTKVMPSMENDQAGLRSLMQYERHAMLYRFHDNLSFIKHEKDWLLPEERATVAAFGLDRASYDPDGEVTETAFWMPLPKSVTKSVDHRGEAQYFAGKASIAIEDDGSIVLEDAYGSQIRMEGGNIFLSARNDVILQPGRNVQAWAPHDLILKSGNSADLTASKGDVRIKAQANLMMAAIDKGVLIESQFQPGEDGNTTPDWSGVGEDVESRGVLIKALKSSVVSMSQDTYIRAGAEDALAPVGQLHIDAGGGVGSVFIHGSEVTTKALANVQMIVGSTGENLDTASFDFSKYNLTIGGNELNAVSLGAHNVRIGSNSTEQTRISLLGNVIVAENLLVDGYSEIGGHTYVDGSLICQNSVLVNGGAYLTGSILTNVAEGSAKTPMTQTVKGNFTLPPEHPARAKELVSSAHDRLQIELNSQLTSDNEQVLQLIDELYGVNSRFASSKLITNARFHFRTPEQYGTTTDFKWFEARWQEMNRKLFGQTQVWQENELTAPSASVKTMPYPGYEIWEDNTSFVTLDNVLFDFVAGVDTVRAIETPELPKPQDTSFKRGYIVTQQRNT